MQRSTRGQTELDESSRPRPRTPDARNKRAPAQAAGPHLGPALQRVARDPSSRGGADILALQGAVGNQAVQRRIAASRAAPRPHVPSDGAGRAMPPAVQTKMERAFSTDFSTVRIYEGPRAAALGALAYTQGDEVHFASGHYQPNSAAGQALLGHELAHTIQQRQGRVPTTLQLKGVGVNDDAALEREADVAGARAARGEIAMPRSDRSATEAGVPAARPKRPSAPPLAAPIQRIVAPRISKESPEARRASDRDLQNAYDAVWQHLWQSPAARHIYASVHAHPHTVDVRVGADDTKVSRNRAGGAFEGPAQVVGDWDMEWNPWYFGAIVDQARDTLTANGTTLVAPGHMTGTISPAMLLLHEFGHVQQDIEAEEFGQGATPAGGATTTPWGDITTLEAWVDGLHTALHLCHDKLKLPRQALPSVHNEIIEGDNVSRHERKAQDDLREPTRAEYANTLVFNDLQPLAKRVLDDAGFDPGRPAPELRASVSRAVRFQRGPQLNTQTIVDHLTQLAQHFRDVQAHNAGLPRSLLPPYLSRRLTWIIAHLGEARTFWTQKQAQLQQARQQAGAQVARVPTFANP